MFNVPMRWASTRDIWSRPIRLWKGTSHPIFLRGFQPYIQTYADGWNWSFITIWARLLAFKVFCSASMGQGQLIFFISDAFLFLSPSTQVHVLFSYIYLGDYWYLTLPTTFPILGHFEWWVLNCSAYTPSPYVHMTSLPRLGRLSQNRWKMNFFFITDSHL